MYPHPYKSAPTQSFWGKAVAKDFDAAALVNSELPLIRRHELVASAGSCFAANIVPYIEQAGFTYLRTEPVHPLFSKLETDNFSYGKFSAAYGNLYTARQLLQLLRRVTGEFTPMEDRWETPEGIIDPFRPGLKYPASTHREFDLLTAQHLRKVREVFTRADVFVFTLGLTEAWMSSLDGAVFPACPGTVRGSFDPSKHVFKNFTTSEIVADMLAFITEVRVLNPSLRIIVTVSPVPLVATATAEHVLSATIYSKSVLRAAAGEVCYRATGTTYFPAYEIITGPQAPYDYFEDDRRTPSQKGIGEVMRVLLNACQTSGTVTMQPPAAKSAAPETAESAPSSFSDALTRAECEEAAAAF